MKAWEIICYTYEADAHCTECAANRFGESLLNESKPPLDREGNPIHPMFGSDLSDCDGSPTCGTCCKRILEDF